MTRSERTLMCSSGWGACEGQALALRAPRRVFFVALRGTGPRTTGPGDAFFFVVRRPSRLYQRDAGFPASPPLPPQSLPHPGHPVYPGHPASDARAIKVLTDLFSVLRRRAIDIKVFQTFACSSCSSCSSWLSCFRQLNACEGQALALRGAGCVFFVARGGLSRALFLRRSGFPTETSRIKFISYKSHCPLLKLFAINVIFMVNCLHNVNEFLFTHFQRRNYGKSKTRFYRHWRHGRCPHAQPQGQF